MQISNIYFPKQKDAKTENSRKLEEICKMVANICKEGKQVLAMNTKQAKENQSCL